MTEARTPLGIKASAVCSETRGNGKFGGITFSSVASWPGALNPAMPPVTIKDRFEPASTEPKASMARWSISQFSLNFKKS